MKSVLIPEEIILSLKNNSKAFEVFTNLNANPSEDNMAWVYVMVYENIGGIMELRDPMLMEERGVIQREHNYFIHLAGTRIDEHLIAKNIAVSNIARKCLWIEYGITIKNRKQQDTQFI